MLALSIIALVGAFIINIVLGVNAGFDNYSANYVPAAIAIALASLAVVGLVSGIKGIRDPLIRKKAIAQTIISGIAIMYCLAVALIGFVSAATGGLVFFDNIFAYSV